MAKKRKKKLGSLGSTTVNIDLSVEILDQIILYIFTDPDSNPFINRKSLSNINELLTILDKRAYETDEVAMARISFIQHILKLELKENIYNYDLLLSKGLEEGTHKDEIQNSIIPFIEQNEYSLTMEEIKYINKFVGDRIKYAYLYKHKEYISQLFEDLSTNRFDSMADINRELEEALARLSNDIRRVKMEDEENSFIDFSDVSFENNLIEMANEIKKPTKFLKTGIIKLNQMLNGGFESGRLYLFMGITGGFKSGILLNILYWIKKYNKNFQPKDPNKIPTVLYITQENSVNETMERLWNIGCSNKDIKTCSNKSIIKKFRTNDFAIDEENNINICIMYRPNKSISTDDLYNIYDDLLDDGKECVCVIHDYTKRIRPSIATGELRLDLSNVVDEETVNL